mmetsp:Transcript_44695/g.118587  ORF Transcript_44695/g.118587 Transcript_44695/m.118587 type:complete len:415 (-) Transcript_44695:44-1288(-)
MQAGVAQHEEQSATSVLGGIAETILRGVQHTLHVHVSEDDEVGACERVCHLGVVVVDATAALETERRPLPLSAGCRLHLQRRWYGVGPTAWEHSVLRGVDLGISPPRSHAERLPNHRAHHVPGGHPHVVILRQEPDVCAVSSFCGQRNVEDLSCAVQLPKRVHQRCDVCGAVRHLDDLLVRWICDHRGGSQAPKHRCRIRRGQFHREQVLCDLHIIVEHTPQRVALRPGLRLVTISWPIRSRRLHDEPFAVRIPSHKSFAVSPGFAAVVDARRVQVYVRVLVELVVPNDVVRRLATVDLVEGVGDGVGASTNAIGVEGGALDLASHAAAEQILHAEAIRVVLHVTAKDTLPRGAALGERGGVEFVREPPVHLRAIAEKRSQAAHGVRGGKQSTEAKGFAHHHVSTLLSTETDSH